MKKRLNVLISSTQQWNPGDEFIRFGVQNLLKSVLIGVEINWILWNRNPDLFVNHWSDARMKSNFLTNAAREPSLDVIDLVVLAGTPEWYGRPVERIFAELLKYTDIPLLIIGAGSGAAPISLENYEIDVLNRENTLIITRASDLSDEINRILNKEKATALPCPAFFCKGIENAPSTKKTSKLGFILQSSSTQNQSIAEKTVQNILTFLQTLKKLDVHAEIICFYIDEFMRFSRLDLENPVVYHFDARGYLEILGEYELVLSTRLHGAIASLACFTPSILVEDLNYRLSSAQKKFQTLLPIFQSMNLVNLNKDDFLHGQQEKLEM